MADVPIRNGGGGGTTTPPKPKPSTSGGGGSGSGGVSSAEKRANAREDAAKRKAGKRYLKQAANLEAQARALQHALKYDFKKNRDQNLKDLALQLTQQFALLKEGHALRSEQFLGSAKDTEKATADTGSENLSNLARERSDTMSALLEQGAGETDTLRAMVMAARNWSSNQGEANRAYFDSMRSVNQGIVDLNIDTKSALANASVQNEAERERLWADYFNRRSESFTQYGNIRGQQADYYAMAREMGVAPAKGKEKYAEKAMAGAFMDAAEELGKSYKNRGLPEWIEDYKGTPQVTARLSNTNLGAAMDFGKMEKAEGSTLRKWE